MDLIVLLLCVPASARSIEALDRSIYRSIDGVGRSSAFENEVVAIRD